MLSSSDHFGSPFICGKFSSPRPLPELTEDIVRTDHEFWTQFSDRLIGNWSTYDTKVKDITDWVEKVYLRRNFSGFLKAYQDGGIVLEAGAESVRFPLDTIEEARLSPEIEI